MKKLLLVSLVVFSFVIQPGIASADGGMFFSQDFSKYVYSPSQKAVVIWDGSKETIILSTKFTMDEPEAFAWVVPIPSSTDPDISEGDMQIFYDVSRILDPPPRMEWGYGILAIGKGIGVEVIEETKIDIYDIAVLKATDADVLVDWLNDNGYVTPEEAVPTLEYYVNQDDFYFIANRINLSNKYPGMEITENDTECLNAILGTDIYLRNIPDYFLSWYSECSEASKQTVETLYKLNAGISTPIKIEFRPESPFYPMKMTSVNEGEVKVNVYVFSPSPVRDTSGLMEIDQMTTPDKTVTSEFSPGKYYLTSLTFEDETSELVSDSFFEATTYAPERDPRYVSPMEIVTESLSQFFFVLFIISILFGPALIIGIFFGAMLRKTEKMEIKLIVLLLVVIAETVFLFFITEPYFLIAPTLIVTGFGFFSGDWKYGRNKWILAAIIVLAMLFIMSFMFMQFAVFF